MIDRPIVCDVETAIASLTVTARGTLVFDAAQHVSLLSSGNVVVRGALRIGAQQPTIRHRLMFTGVDEARFVGGGVDVLDTDVGLWVMGDGGLTVEGAPRLGWARSAAEIPAGATTLTLDADPSGWQPGDELVLVPTLPPDQADRGRDGYDIAEIAGIDGRTVRLSRPTTVGHPTVPIGRDQSINAEVLNLTRNVEIGGTPNGRAHIFIRSTRPQSVRGATLRHLAPQHRTPIGDDGATVTDSVLGRYGLHFHHCHDGSRGSVVESVVARDLGGHAFVPHMSHGTTWRQCVSHDTHDAALWWDVGDASVDTMVEQTVVSRLQPNYRDRYTLTGFRLGAGAANSNILRGCVAVGSQGSGFFWGEASDRWIFEDCVAHNNAESGIRVWQNVKSFNLVSRFVGFHNSQYGVDHGAYGSRYRYEDSRLVANGAGGVFLQAVSFAGTTDRTLQFVDLYVDAGGTKFAFAVPDGGPIAAGAPTLVHGCEFVNASRAAIHLYRHEDRAAPSQIDVRDCRFDGNEFWLSPDIAPDAQIVFEDTLRSSIAILRADQPGTPRAVWNAVTRPV